MYAIKNAPRGCLVLKNKSLIWFHCSVTFLLPQLYQQFLNTKKLSTACVRQWTVGVFMSAHLNGAQWVNSMGWKRNICPAWRCRPPGSSANTISMSKAQQEGSGVCWWHSYSSENYLFEENKIYLEKRLKYPNLKMKLVKVHGAASLQTT